VGREGDPVDGVVVVMNQVSTFNWRNIAISLIDQRSKNRLFNKSCPGKGCYSESRYFLPGGTGFLISLGRQQSSTLKPSDAVQDDSMRWNNSTDGAACFLRLGLAGP
jgi:hypothetical protein